MTPAAIPRGGPSPVETAPVVIKAEAAPVVGIRAEAVRVGVTKAAVAIKGVADLVADIKVGGAQVAVATKAVATKAVDTRAVDTRAVVIKGADDLAAVIRVRATRVVGAQVAVVTKAVVTKVVVTKVADIRAAVTKEVAMPGADRGSRGQRAAFGVRPVSEVNRARDSRDLSGNKANSLTRRIGQVIGLHGPIGRRIRRSPVVPNGRMSPIRMTGPSGPNSRITRSGRLLRINRPGRPDLALIAPSVRTGRAVRFARVCRSTSRGPMWPERSTDATPVGPRLPGLRGS